MIEDYKFGKITINGRTYSGDLEISQEGVTLWQINDHHCPTIEDIQPAINKNPEVIIFGAGYSGFVNIPVEMQRLIKSKGIKLIMRKTKEAVEEYNRLSRKKKVIGLFHLTC